MGPTLLNGLWCDFTLVDPILYILRLSKNQGSVLCVQAIVGDLDLTYSISSAFDVQVADTACTYYMSCRSAKQCRQGEQKWDKTDR